MDEQTWRSLAEDGRYREAYAAARRIGFEALQRRASAGDLVLLGDSARHAGNPAEAVAAYETARQRSPGTEPAAVAAFSLGRLAFEASEVAAARRWLNVYLTERPAGALAEAALGRLFDLARGRDTAEALTIAKDYIRRHPNGPRAAEAASVLGSAKADASR
jgi:TolA-binding protein